jgi:putative serine protease PepD
MDETTNTPRTNPTALDDTRNGTTSGWSSPTASGEPPRQQDPWTAQAEDTGAMPRPDDTRAFDAQPATEQNPPLSYPSAGQPPAGPPEAPGTTGKPPRRVTALMLALALGAGLAGGAAGAGVVSALDDDPATVTSSLDREPASADNAVDFSSVEDVAAQVLPSVVSISIDSQFGSGTGSGVIISSDGQILTNNHVAEAGENGGNLTVTFSDGTTADAEVVGLDPITDLAVIQAQDVSGLTPAELGSSDDLQVGEQVVAIGSPLGLDGTVTTGIVSALDRPVTAGDRQTNGQAATIDAIQTDAPINPGNSGGPLVNMSGQVVGINSAIATTGSEGSIGLGFSIPIDQARPIAEELAETGQATHAMIGVSIGDARGDTRGAAIQAVEPGSAAADAGLQEGDVVTKIDDRLITDGTSLVAAARSYRPGDTVTLTYVRGGETQTAEVTLGSDAESS